MLQIHSRTQRFRNMVSHPVTTQKPYQHQQEFQAHALWRLLHLWTFVPGSGAGSGATAWGDATVAPCQPLAAPTAPLQGTARSHSHPLRKGKKLHKGEWEKSMRNCSVNTWSRGGGGTPHAHMPNGYSPADCWQDHGGAGVFWKDWSSLGRTQPE